MTNFQIGAQMYSVRTHCQDAGEMLTCLKVLKTMGYNCCQLSAHSRDISAEQLRDMLDESGMTCACTHIGFQEMEEDIDKVIREHKLWNCAYPGIGGLPGEFRGGSEGYIEFAKRASKVAEKLRDNGMHFIYHNHAFEFQRFEDTGKSGIELLMENCSDAVQFELDLFWVQMGGGNPLDWIEKVRGRMDVVHFKEMNGSKENKGVIAPIGKGNMNWAAIMDKCDEIGVKYAMIEQDNAVSQGSLDCMLYSLNTLKKLGGRF